MVSGDERIQAELREAIRTGDADRAESLAHEAVQSGMAPLDIVQDIMVPELVKVGERFQNSEVYLPELMMAGDAAEKVTQVVEEAAMQRGETTVSQGTVVLGQVKGDLHDIGRNIVGTLLKSHGFKVVDLGRDVPASKYLDAAEQEQADIVALSSLMTTTLPAQERTVHLFSEVGKRDQYRIIVGGGAVSEAWAERIGADGYSATAAGAVELCKSLLSR